MEKQRQTKWSRTSWKDKFFSSSWVLECFFLCFWENVLSTSYVVHYVMYAHVGKSWNSHSLIWVSFIPVLEVLFSKVARLKTCIFIKQETPATVLSCEYCEIFKNSFFNRTSCLLYFSEILCDNIILWASLDTKLIFSKYCASTIMVELLKFRIMTASPGNILWKMWYEFFQYYALLLPFFRRDLAKHS